MTRNEQGIPMDVLRELISLDADTGVLTWKRRLAHHHKPTAKRTAEHIAANALYQIEVDHVESVTFDGAMVRELLS